LCKTVYDAFEDTFRANNITMGQMVVHRLGMDTSGLIVFCQTMEAVRGMHTMFRSRQVVKQYEALVCGHVETPVQSLSSSGGVGSEYSNHDSDDDDNDSNAKSGIIQMPLMRDYERPPYMRISTRDHQRAIASLDEPRLVHKQFLEAPKSCITQYQIGKRDYWNDDTQLPVTRLTLTSISGRTHQLNVHCAAMGHPIVADSVYGWNGEATPRGGLIDDSKGGGASLELQEELYKATSGTTTNMCIHATFLSFRHPVTKTMLSIRSPAPF
jgi:tRNA pseudouridine32 synthase/23S rRNA pseudouridine746 synthase